MKTMFADFNAMTESDGIRLTTRGSQAAIQRDEVQLGDRVWLTDGELVVGALVAEDAYYGVVGEPDWDTLVHLDDDEAQDVHKVLDGLQTSLRGTRGTADDEARVFELLTQFDHVAPPLLRDQRPGYLAFRRAAALLAMNKPELGLIEIREARAIRPDDPAQDFLYLSLLRRVAPDRAVEEARRFARDEGTAAIVLASAINILADQAEALDETGFAPEARRILDLCDRFDRAPGRSEIAASHLALVHFNRGMLLLRLDQRDQARAAIDLAHAIEPSDPDIVAAGRLGIDDPKAREIASRVRSKPYTTAA